MSKIKLKSESDLKKLEKSGRILSSVLQFLREEAAVGVNLVDLDKKAKKMIKEAGGDPAFLGYKPAGAKEPYPASICASVNEVVVHGIPKDYDLKDGDIVTFDCGVSYQGYITDSAVSVAVGDIDEKSKKLLTTTKQSLIEALAVCKPGNHIGDIGDAIENVVDKTDFKIIKNLTGHGVGFELHEEPTILNYSTKRKGEEIVPGMVLAVEPMLSFSSEFVTQDDQDCYITSDGSRSAHFEVTVAITKEGNKVLTPIKGVVK